MLTEDDCLTDFVQPGIPAGDVVFVLKASPHESFERSGNDLLTHVTITLSEALLGFSRILITHLDGRGVKVTSPYGKILKPEDSVVLRGEGMPVYKRPDQKGDLYVIFSIEMPDEQWLKTVNQKVRNSAPITGAVFAPCLRNPETHYFTQTGTCILTSAEEGGCRAASCSRGRGGIRAE